MQSSQILNAQLRETYKRTILPRNSSLNIEKGDKGKFRINKSSTQNSLYMTKPTNTPTPSPFQALKNSRSISLLPQNYPLLYQKKQASPIEKCSNQPLLTQNYTLLYQKKQNVIQEKSKNQILISNEDATIQQNIRILINQNVTFLNILKEFCYNLQILSKYRSQRVTEQLITQLGDYQPKFRELKYTFFHNSKYSDWSTSFFIDRIVETYNLKNRNILKNSTIDQNFVKILQDFNSRLQEVINRFEENKYKAMEEKIILDKQKLKLKEFTLVKLFQFQNKEKNKKFLDIIAENRNEFNLRCLLNNMVDQIKKFEDKHGRFSLVNELTRNTSSKINSLVESIKQAEQL